MSAVAERALAELTEAMAATEKDPSLLTPAMASHIEQLAWLAHAEVYHPVGEPSRCPHHQPAEET